MLNPIFLQISILLGLTVSVAFLMRLLKQPLMVGYLIAGIVAGPFMLNIFHGESEMFQALAQFGVVLLLFVVGLSLNFDHIKKIGKVSLFTGLAQVFFTATIGFLLLTFLNFSLTSSIFLAIAITFSSTIIIVKLLTDKKDLDSVYGKYTIGLMIVQDLVAILLMIVMTSFTADTPLSVLFSEMIIKIILLTALVIFLARFIIPRVLDNIAKSSEFLFIFTLAWCFGVASLLHWLGFSIEVGALIAGLSLGSSPYQPEISSRIKPLRDFFIVIFFIILGSEFILSDLSTILLPSIILSLFILIGNPFILYHSFRRFKFTRRNSFLAGVTAAQVSEFGFVVLITAQQMGYVKGDELSIFTLVALITIILSTYGITYNEQLYRYLLPLFNKFGRDKNRQPEEKIKQYDVWVFGYHRIGWKVCEALAEKGVSFAVVDFNPNILYKLKRRNIKAYFGDASDVEFLSTLPLEKARMVISTIPEVDDQKTLIKYIRSKNNKTKILASVYHQRELEQLYRAGANYVMMPHLLGGNWIADIIKERQWSKRTFNSLKKDQKEEMQLRFTAETHE